MQDIILEIIKSLNDHVVDDDIRVAIYSDLIPHIRLSDPNLAEELCEDELYAEAYDSLEGDVESEDE